MVMIFERDEVAVVTGASSVVGRSIALAWNACSLSLRQKVNPQGIRGLSVFLGRTATPMQEAICKQEGRPYDPACFIQPEEVASTLVHSLGLPRNAEIIDLTIRPMKPTPTA